MKGVTVIDHPLVQHKLTRLRDASTPPAEFRRLLAEITLLMAPEATRSFAVKSVPVKTPLTTTRGFRLRRDILIVPILRAGLGMLDSILQLIPEAHVGFVGLKRDENTLQATAYLKSLPEDLSRFEILLIDPMLATGGSTVAALRFIAQRGGKRVRLLNIIAAPAGIREVRAHDPKLRIFTAAIDRKLNERGFIVPGLGDAGDRQFGG